MSAPAATGDTSSAWSCQVMPLRSTSAKSAFARSPPPPVRSMPRAAGCRPGPAAPVPSTHGVGLALPIVMDSRTVALNDSVMWKNSTFTDSEMDTPASKVRWIGW